LTPPSKPPTLQRLVHPSIRLEHLPPLLLELLRLETLLLLRWRLFDELLLFLKNDKVLFEAGGSERVRRRRGGKGVGGGGRGVSRLLASVKGAVEGERGSSTAWRRRRIWWKRRKSRYGGGGRKGCGGKRLVERDERGGLVRVGR
jgi:hypothetical protein